MRSGFALSDRAISNDEDLLTYLLSTGYVDMPRERLPHAKTSNLWVCGAHMFSISTAADSEWIPLQRTRNIFSNSINSSTTLSFGVPRSSDELEIQSSTMVNSSLVSRNTEEEVEQRLMKTKRPEDKTAIFRPKSLGRTQHDGLPASQKL